MGMGVDTTNTNQGSKRRKRNYRAMSEINMTPFVDVMLVLLIIFMVSAPMLTAGVPVDLPETNASPIQSDKDPLTITVNKNGEIYIKETQIKLNELGGKLQSVSKNGIKDNVYVRGDAKTTYSIIAKVMGVIQEAGFKKVNLITNLAIEQ